MFSLQQVYWNRSRSDSSDSDEVSLLWRDKGHIHSVNEEVIHPHWGDATILIVQL